MNIDLNEYQKFVSEVTSPESKDLEAFVSRARELKETQNLDLNRLLTASVGMAAEAGEFSEIVKKMAFQGKPYNEDNREHMLLELGDTLWYLVQACVALGSSVEEVVSMNHRKLSKRYPELQFSVERSENRKVGDR